MIYISSSSALRAFTWVIIHPYRNGMNLFRLKIRHQYSCKKNPIYKKNIFFLRNVSVHILDRGVESFYLIYERQKYDENHRSYSKIYILVWQKSSKFYFAIKKQKKWEKIKTLYNPCSAYWELSYELSYTSIAIVLACFVLKIHHRQPRKHASVETLFSH